MCVSVIQVVVLISPHLSVHINHSLRLTFQPGQPEEPTAAEDEGSQRGAEKVSFWCCGFHRTFCTHYRSLSADPLTFVFHFSLTPRRKRTRGASHVDQRLRGCSQFCRLPRMLYHVVHSQIDLCDSLSGTRDMLRSLLCHHGAVFGFPFGLPFGSKQPT